MFTISKTGLPGITCERCREPAILDSLVVIRYPDLSAIHFICIDCAEMLKEKFPQSEFIDFRAYMGALLSEGRPRRVSDVRI